MDKEARPVRYVAELAVLDMACTICNVAGAVEEAPSTALFVAVQVRKNKNKK